MVTRSSSITDTIPGDPARRPTVLAGTPALNPPMIESCRPTRPPNRSTCRAAAAVAPGSACTITEISLASVAGPAVPAAGGSTAITTAASTAIATSRTDRPPSLAETPARMLLLPWSGGGPVLLL
jgi:hypothetical protein